MLDLLVTAKVLTTAVLAASIIAARLAPPPPRRPRGLVPALLAMALIGCIAGLLDSPLGTVCVALAVEASAAALWLIRAPETGGDEGGGGGGGQPPPPPKDPDAPDPAAFDWDAFERSGRTPVGAGH